MAPVYESLYKYKDLDVILIHSGQHDEMALQAMDTFNLQPHFICSLSKYKKSELGYLVSHLIHEFTDALVFIKPNLVLVHGDTTTAFSGAVASFLKNISVGHIEAGLRTSRFEYPFPEEGYRRAISRITTYHFAPTPKSSMNLMSENITKNVYITGNTIVDALKKILLLHDSHNYKSLKQYIGNNKYVLVTCHRRESYGEPLVNLCKTINRIAFNNKDVIIVWPVHLNPAIKNTVTEVCNHERILLTNPLDYDDCIKLIESANVVITDSGGVMEEAAVLTKPTLVLRTETERPEVLDLDTVRLVGYNFEELENFVGSWLQTPPLSIPSTIFGDGTAGEEIAEIIYGLSSMQKKE